MGASFSWLTPWTAKEVKMVDNFLHIERQVANMGATVLKIMRHPDATDEMVIDVRKRYADAYAGMVSTDAELVAALVKLHERRKKERNAKKEET